MSSFEPSATQTRAEFVPTTRTCTRGFEPGREAASTPAEAAASPPVAAIDLAAPPAADAATNVDEQEAMRREAFETGREAGLAERHTGVESAVAALEHAARNVTQLQTGYLTAHRRAAVELGLAVAEHVLQRSLAGNAEGLADVAARAIAKLETQDPVTVRVAGSDYAALEAADPAMLVRLRSETSLDLAADAELAPGDLRVEAGDARIDARLSEILHRVREELMGTDLKRGDA